MKKAITSLILICVLLSAAAPAARADVLLSELCDPRLNYLTDRYIEIWNSGASPVDLTGWQVVAVGNGVDIFTWTLSGTIAAGEALVVGDATTVVSFQVDFPAEAWSDNTTNWNGKVGDGARLENGSGTVIDEVVAPDTLFENDTLVRNEGVTTPSTSYVASQWTATPVDYPTDATPGEHHEPAVTGPTVTDVATTPASPLPLDPVDVQATVVDASYAIAGVELYWGGSAAAMTNVIPMTAVGGDVYETASPIPGQAAGSTVYYQVSAANDAPATTLSDVYSYSPPLSLTVADVQGAADASPYLGDEVVVSGVVTADFGTAFVIQDGTGARSGLWVYGATAPALGTEVEVRGQVAEPNSNTVIENAQINDSVAGSIPAAEVLTTGTAALEDWEGVLVQVVDASCVLSDSATPRWQVSNTGGSVDVDDLGVSPDLVYGTRYTVTGPVSGSTAAPGIVPRTAADVVFVGDTAAPVVYEVDPLNQTTLEVTFSEDVTSVTALNVANYAFSAGSVTGAAYAAGRTDKVSLTVTGLENGDHILTVDGVEDGYGNVMVDVATLFYYYGGNIPAGYYDPADGLLGDDLHLALHLIIDNHTSISYTAIWSAFYTTDDKPNGKVWDMYSDVPDGTPPYEYDFGVDEGGSAGSEGSGYNREHSWPSSWYGATSPMYTDLFMVYPTDNEVNNRRGSYPYGEVDSPTWTSLNGCRLGPCSYPGYTGVVFEPIDEYKGDFARAYFYMTTRYLGEDASWPGSDMTDGATLLPWAENLLLDWHADDPVDAKEIDRNEAVYAIQGNRNPFIDRPDFVLKVFRPETVDVPVEMPAAAVVLHQNMPNPFNPATTIVYELTAPADVDLRVYDLTGRLIRVLERGQADAGLHERSWRGRDERGRPVAAGVYFYRLDTGKDVETKRMTLVK